MTQRTEGRATVPVRLTEAGARDVPGYEPGQRVELGVKLAEYFADRGWAVILDPDPDPELDPKEAHP